MLAEQRDWRVQAQKPTVSLAAVRWLCRRHQHLFDPYVEVIRLDACSDVSQVPIFSRARMIKRITLHPTKSYQPSQMPRIVAPTSKETTPLTDSQLASARSRLQFYRSSVLSIDSILPLPSFLTYRRRHIPLTSIGITGPVRFDLAI